MAIQRDLKAFVRYDGSGRVVAGSLILRKNKPKVGRWQEIPAYECCNYIPTSTTTTTTTASPTTTTTSSSTSTSTSTTTSTSTSTTTTTTTAFAGTYYVADTSAEVCGGTGLYSLPLIVDPEACTNGLITLAVGSYPDYGITNGSTIYINLQNGNVIQVQTFNNVQMSFGCTSCG
jgi:hypothetical protein